MKKLFLFLLSIVFLVSCQRADSSGEGQEVDFLESEALSDFRSGTFEGTVPCHTCEGVYMQLVLKPDNTYQLSEGFIKERVYPVKTWGNWLSIDEGEKVLLQPAQTDDMRYLEIKDVNTLVLLVPENKHIENKLDYGLSRVDPKTGDTAEEVEWSK